MKCYTCAYAHVVKSRHCLENHPTTNLTYDIHCALLLDYNKQQFHSKESLTRLFQQVLLMRGYVTLAQWSAKVPVTPVNDPMGGPKVLG